MFDENEFGEIINEIENLVAAMWLKMPPQIYLDLLKKKRNTIKIGDEYEAKYKGNK
jgi:hypothetical protein